MTKLTCVLKQLHRLLLLQGLKKEIGLLLLLSEKHGLRCG